MRLALAATGGLGPPEPCLATRPRREQPFATARLDRAERPLRRDEQPVDLVRHDDRQIWLNRGGADTVVLNSSVGHDVFINAGGGDDSITLDEGFSMNPSTRLRI